MFKARKDGRVQQIKNKKSYCVVFKVSLFIQFI